MYYVYHGYVSPDNYDASEGPIFKLTECETEGDVLKLKEQFEQEIHAGCAHVIFRVFKGKELELEAEEKVTVWKLKNKTQ